MRLLALPAFGTSEPSINRYIPILHEMSRWGHEVTIVFPYGSPSEIAERYRTRLRFSFISPTPPPALGLKRSLGLREGRVGLAGVYDISQRILRHTFFMTESFDIQIAIRTVAVARGCNPDIIYVMGPGTRNGLAGMLLGRRFSSPLVLDIEDYTINEYNPTLSMFGGVTVASNALRWLFRRYSPLYYPHSSDFMYVEPSQYKIDRVSPPELVWHGIVYPHMVESFSQLFRGLSLVKEDFRLGIVGRGEMKRLVGRANELGLANRLSVEDWMQRPALIPRLMRSSIGVLCPTKRDFDLVRSPGKIYDYMALELPVLSHDVGEAAYVVRKAECGVTVDFDDPSAVAKGIEILLHDERLRRRMGQNGRAYLARLGGFERWAKELESFLSARLR